MKRGNYKKTAHTRASLLEKAEQIAAQKGYATLRVEEVTKEAGVSKGTFFTHFKDKDALMDEMLGAKMHAILEDIRQSRNPKSVKGIIDRLLPLIEFMTCERYVFDVIFRYSGAAEIEHIGPIAETFGMQVEIFSEWAKSDVFRKDVSSDVLGEGIQAFLMQIVALKFCALHKNKDLKSQFHTYLSAWLEEH